jgi:hypothetical protein
MTRARALYAVTALVAAYALLRLVAAPGAEPYATLARPAPGVTAGVASGPVPPSAAEVRAALAALDAARARGYADPAAADPDEWSARTCACRREDVRRLRSLARRGLALRGHRSRLLSLAVARAGPHEVTLVVTDRVSPYAAVDRRGRTVARWPASGPRRWQVTLVRVADRWVFGRIARAPPEWRGV